MNVNEACRSVLSCNKGFKYIGSITDISHSWVIELMPDDGGELDMPPYMVNKKSGDLSVCFPPEHWEELSKGKTIEVPEEFKYH